MIFSIPTGEAVKQTDIQLFYVLAAFVNVAGSTVAIENNDLQAGPISTAAIHMWMQSIFRSFAALANYGTFCP